MNFTSLLNVLPSLPLVAFLHADGAQRCELPAIRVAPTAASSAATPSSAAQASAAQVTAAHFSALQSDVPPATPPVPATPAAEPSKALYLKVERGPGLLPLYVPRGEELRFDVEIDVGISNLDVGDVELSSGVDPFRAGLPGATPNPVAGAERGWVRSVATGSYLGYRLEHELKTRLLPQAFPSLFHTDSQRGSENRNRELKIGLRENVRVAEFRSDGHCKGCANKEHFIESKWLWGDAEHCKKCKLLEHREWKDPLTRPVPEGTLDMLSAVYLARTLVRERIDSATFPVIDRQKVWEVTVTRDKTKKIETDAGTFECQQVKLSTRFLAEENEKEEPSSSQFQGLFGIQGTIQIWLEVHTGVPVLIQGELPIPLPLVDHLDVRVKLKSFKGTPPEFKP